MPWGRLVAVLAVLILGWAVLGGDRPADAGAAPSGLRMKVNLYRAQVHVIEAILYSEEASGTSDVGALITETERLASLMQQSESRLSMTPLILDIRAYAGFVAQVASNGFDAAARDDARREWERVRAQVFEDDEPTPTSAQ